MKVGWIGSSVLKNLYLRKHKILLLKLTQNIMRSLKYIGIGGPRSEVVLFSPVLEGIPEFNGNFTVEGDNESNFTVNFVIDRGQGKKALVELGKNGSI